MDWYYYIALAAILSQILFLLAMYRNYRYVLSKYKKKRLGYRPRTAVILPCKGIDSEFEKNIASFFNQDYENYSLWFVVADSGDPAYAKLCELRNRLGSALKKNTDDIRVFLAGQADSCSQKIHNLLCAYRAISQDVEVLAFADSDVCVHRDWLSQLVYPLRKDKNGVASGYRWFVPQKNNLATLALSAVNAKIAQMLGPSVYNHAWGGSMAVRTEVFRRLGIEKIWSKAVSDDLSLSCAAKKAGLKVVFVPACLVASYVQTNWHKFFEFGRRQFLITRITAPATWWLGVFSSLYSTLGLWAGAAVAVYAKYVNEPQWCFFAAVPVLFFAGHLWCSSLRQRIAAILLKDDLPKLKFAMLADILASWIWSPFLLFVILSSAVGRTVHWRGIKYKLLGPTEIIMQAGEN